MFLRLKTLGAALALIAPVLSACDRATLRAAADSLVAAQAAGDPSKLAALSPSATYTENFKSAQIASGILKAPLKIDHNRTTVDTTQCATYTEIIVSDTSHPYVLGSQMRFSEDGTQIVKVETLVTDQGDWFFNAANTLKYVKQEDAEGKWGTIPEAERDTRAVIQAAGDAYLDLFSNKSVVVPWGSPCTRLEGGTWFSPNCNVGVPSGVSLVNRRYVIDETTGSVDIFLSFGGPSGMPDSHEFRITKGKITSVHTLTVSN
jgi:hypothetical protein